MTRPRPLRPLECGWCQRTSQRHRNDIEVGHMLLMGRRDEIERTCRHCDALHFATPAGRLVLVRGPLESHVITRVRPLPGPRPAPGVVVDVVDEVITPEHIALEQYTIGTARLQRQGFAHRWVAVDPHRREVLTWGTRPGDPAGVVRIALELFGDATAACSSGGGRETRNGG